MCGVLIALVNCVKRIYYCMFDAVFQIAKEYSIFFSTKNEYIRECIENY